MATALVLLTLFIGTGPRPAADADPVSDKRAEAASMAARLNDQARRIVALDVHYRAAEREASEAEAAVANAEAQVAATVRRQDDIKRQLVVTAQDAYVGGGTVSVLRYLVDTKEGDEVARRAYLRIVTGQDRQLIGQLRTTREDLDGLRGRFEAARRKARAEAESIDADRRALDQAIRVQRSNLAAINDELARLVAAEQTRLAEQAARAAAAAAPKAAPTPAAGPTAAPALAPANAMPMADAWHCIRQLESGNNYATPGGGAYQFLDSTWQSLGYTGTASDAPPAVQDEAAVKLQARSGWSQWTTAPLCGVG